MSVAITYFISYVTEALIAYYYLDKIFISKVSKTATCLFYSLFFGLQYLLSFPHFIWLNSLSFILFTLLLIIMIYKVNFILAVFHTTIMTVVMASGEMITNALLGSIYYQYKAADMKYIVFVIYYVVSKMLYFILMAILAHFLSKNSGRKYYTHNIFLMLLIPGLSLGILATFYYICTSIQLSKTTEWLIIYSSFFTLLINVILVFLFEYNSNRQYKITQLELEIQRETDSKQYNRILEQQDEDQRILIHDIKRHLETIRALNLQKDSTKIDQYISNLLANSSLSKSFKPTRNKLLNLILSRYIVTCETKHIDFKIDAQNTNIDFIVSEDITSLFCNLLDNAIEASEAMPNALIELKIADNEETSMTLISVVNSCRTTPKSTTSNHYISLKPSPQNHGIGMRSIHKIVEKYKGTMQTYYHAAEMNFQVIILLPTNLH